MTVENAAMELQQPQQGKEQVVESLVAWASSETRHQVTPQSFTSTQLRTICANATAVFDLKISDGCLDHFIKLYKDNFWPLWPLIPCFHFRSSAFQPFLLLAMASIGAMYGGKKSALFGTMLHNQLRDELIKPCFDYDIANHDLLSVGQARSLTQAAALYFGQRRAFSYAQHIGGTLVAQARRMNLFDLAPGVLLATTKSATWLDSWIRKESRKRLALAILRLEMYTSVLHGTRPLVSAEELDIELPCSRYLWHTSFASVQAFVAAVEQELSTRNHRPLFSDVFRIAFDADELLPHLETLDQELVFNAMQEQVWAACTARDSLERVSDRTQLSGGSWTVNPRDSRVDIPSTSPLALSLDSYLAHQSRKMKSLHSRFASLEAALEKCHASLNLIPSQMTALDRTSLLSCFLVYHLSLIQLYAPIDAIHSICHQSSTDGSKIEKIIAWSLSNSAPTAQKHAVLIYHLLRSEANKDLERRANVNFLTMIGLYHSAVLLWALAQARENESQDGNVARSLSATEPSMQDFVGLYHDINPAWAVRSSFCTAVQQLADSESPFPRPTR